MYACLCICVGVPAWEGVLTCMDEVKVRDVV